MWKYKAKHFYYLLNVKQFKNQNKLFQVKLWMITALWINVHGPCKLTQKVYNCSRLRKSLIIKQNNKENERKHLLEPK